MTVQFPAPLPGASSGDGEARFPLRQLLVKQAVPVAVVLLALPLCWPYLAQMDLAQGWASMAQIAPWQWAAALVLTAISFAAVGRYDAEIHRVLGTGQSPRAGTIAGMTGIAVAQTTGLGIVIGTLVRWRMLPGAGLVQVLGVNALVAGSFFLGWAVVTALMVLACAPGWPFASVAALAVLAGAAGILALALWSPRIAGRTLPLPPVLRLGALVGYSGIDLIAAGLAFWLLLPAGTEIGFVQILPAFLLASAAGMFGGTPAGIGPFEVALLALSPALPVEPLVCAILAYRLVYYALPAVLGLTALALGPAPFQPQAKTRRRAADLTTAERRRFTALPGPAEHGLIWQGQHDLVPTASGAWMAQTLPQSLTAVFDPAGQADPQALHSLASAARASGRQAAAYKVGPRMAAMARRLGWQVLALGDEALLSPREFSLEGSGKRQLRRKLRQAQTAGITVEEALPSHTLTAIDTAWQTANGAPRGFSMGRYDPAYIARQRLFAAERDGAVLAFASFHESPGGWTLDLMRQCPDAPDGTMHSLIVAAIDSARAQGIPQVSLAAVPRTSLPAGLPGQIAAHLATKGGAAGLRQFKAAFDPRWQARYLVAPTPLALGFAGWDIARALSDPMPLATEADPLGPLQALLTKIMRSLNLIHNHLRGMGRRPD